MAEMKCVGVIGAGQMGSGIAQIAATNGLDVWLMDADRDALSRATTAISSSVKRFVSKGQISKARFTQNSFKASILNMFFFNLMKII